MSVCIIPEHPVGHLRDGRWMSLHNQYVSEAKTSKPDVVFIGDSIIERLLYSNIWTEKISSMHCLNFGIGGDRVEHVLWRLLNGEMDFNVQIKAVVLFVGTNNMDNVPQEIFEGILECIKVIKNKLGDVHVVLPTLLPRGQNPNRFREKHDEINKLMTQKFNNGPNSDFSHIHVVPIHDNIIQSDGTISNDILHDYLHLTNNGYTKIFTPVYEKLCSIVGTR